MFTLEGEKNKWSKQMRKSNLDWKDERKNSGDVTMLVEVQLLLEK